MVVDSYESHCQGKTAEERRSVERRRGSDTGIPMTRRTVSVVLIVLVFLSVAAGTGLAQNEVQFVRGEPTLDVYAPDPTLTPGSTSDITLQVANDGEIEAGVATQRDRVTTARSVTVKLVDDESPFTVETKRQSIGSIPDGEVRDVPITVSVPDDVAPGEYSLDVKLGYSHTSVIAPYSGVTQERSRTVRESIDVVVDDGPRFELRTIDSDVQVGASGTLLTELSNSGEETAHDITVELESTSSDLTFGETTRNTASIDRLEPGENATLSYEADVRPGAALRGLAATGQVRFFDSSGIQDSQGGLAVGFQPNAEQTFSLSVNETTLRVGDTGTLQGTIRNDGPTNVSNVVLTFEGELLESRSPRYAIGDLTQGEVATFRFKGTVPSEAGAAPQQLDVTTRYRTQADTEATTTDSIRVSVADRRDAVGVTAVEPQFSPGEDGVLELDITNQRDIELRDVRLRLAVEAPLESEFQTTVIPSLKPGETEQVAFDLEVDDAAPASRYPATIEAEYLDTHDDRNTDRPSTVAVSVLGADGGGFPTEILIFGFLSILVAAGAWWFYGRE